jgi:hypothetical protein
MFTRIENGNELTPKEIYADRSYCKRYNCL